MQWSAALLFQPRQFPRVSFAVEVKVHCGDEVFVACSREIGGGGMALENAGGLSVAQPVKLCFTLPSGRELRLDAVVWWKRNHRVGIRFDLRDPQCRLIQQWVEEQIKLARTPPV
jgi:hypothetical protein